MICPLKFASADDHLCDKEKCGFYSGEKCAVASLADITSEIVELRTALNHTSETLNDINTRLALVAAAVSTARLFK